MLLDRAQHWKSTQGMSQFRPGQLLVNCSGSTTLVNMRQTRPWNRGAPTSSILLAFSIINHPFCGHGNPDFSLDPSTQPLQDPQESRDAPTTARTTFAQSPRTSNRLSYQFRLYRGTSRCRGRPQLERHVVRRSWVALGSLVVPHWWSFGCTWAGNKPMESKTWPTWPKLGWTAIEPPWKNWWGNIIPPVCPRNVSSQRLVFVLQSPAEKIHTYVRICVYI